MIPRLSIAKLAISIARKLNALIFLVPEGELSARLASGLMLTSTCRLRPTDIVDVRPRLVRSYLSLPPSAPRLLTLLLAPI